MNGGRTLGKTLLAVGAALVSAATLGAIELGQPFSDGLVLQRGMRVPVWGRATPGSVIEVSFAGQKHETQVESNGTWRVALSPLDAFSVGRELKVVETVSKPGLSFGETIDAKTVRDVLVGEVWLASGQSNMECPIWGDCPRYRDANGAMAVAMTFKPQVRFVKVKRDTSLWPRFRSRCASGWKKFEPSSFSFKEEVTFSAVAFYFALELHNALGIPIGIVDVSYGGTNIDAWTPRCAYERCDPALKAIAQYRVREEKDWKAERDRMGPIDGFHQQPALIYNAMVAPFAPMAVRGFLWYQGCNNGWDNPQIFCKRLHALYDGWSRVFERPDLSMLMVHLAPWAKGWMPVWKEQNRFAAEEKNCALAVTADIGNEADIHPADKLTVARRLAFQALRRNYGFKIPVTDAPMIRKASFDGNRATLSFDNVKTWYFYAPDRSEEIAFELAGEDGKWHKAKFENGYSKGWVLGRVEGSEIRLSCAEVPVVKHVRYLGADGRNGTLFSFETSLPLAPFEL